MSRFTNTILSIVRFVSRERTLLAAVASLVLWVAVVSPFVTSLRSNFSYKAEMHSVDNFYDPVSGAFKGEQYSKSSYSFEVASTSDDIAYLRNSFVVRSLEGKLIYKSEPVYAVDRKTWSRVDVPGLDFPAQVFAPEDVGKDSVFYFSHPTSDRPIKMVFDGEDELYGLKVYRFKKADIVEFDQTDTLGFLDGVPEKYGVKLKNDMHIWIEPISGYLVSLEDYSVDYYFYDIKTGEKVHPYNQFSNRFTESSIIENVTKARWLRSAILLNDHVIPWIFVAIAVYILVRKFKSKSIKTIDGFVMKNLLPASVLVVTLAMSYAGYTVIKVYFNDKTTDFLQSESNGLRDVFSREMDKHIVLLLGGRGLFDSSDVVERSEWKTYVSSLYPKEDYYAVQGIGYVPFVDAKGIKGIEEKARKSGITEYKVRPEGVRSMYAPIFYLEPDNERNHPTLGYDMYSEEVRRRAIDKAIETGSPSASGKVVLVQDEKNSKPGFVIYVPVYGKHASSSVIEKSPVMGFVYTPVRFDLLVQKIVGSSFSDLDFFVYDGLKPTHESLMYSTSSTTPDERPTMTNEFRRSEAIFVAGRPWTIITIGKNSGSMVGSGLAEGAFILGIIISIVLTSLVASLSRSRKRAVEYADKVTVDLKNNVKDLENSKTAMLNLLEDINIEKNKNEIYAEVISGTADAVLMLDLNGAITEWNNAAETLYGYSKEETVGKNVTIISPEKEEDLRNMISKIQSGEKVAKFNVKQKRKDGGFVDASLTISAVRSAKGDLIGVSIVARDVTKETEIDRVKTEFVSLASHQLKTPIGAVKWDAEMLLNGDYGPLKPEQTSVVQEIYGLNTRMSELINVFLNISRIELETFAIEPVEVSYTEVADDVLAELRERIALKKVEVVRAYGEGLKPMLADKKLLRIVFQNLLSNAVKYTLEGGHVTVGITADTAAVKISVKNTGKPIPREEQPRLFSKMFRAKDAQTMDPDGNGLGLYLLKSIVEAAGGRVGFESGEGKETEFYVIFEMPGMKKKAGGKELS